MTNEETESTIEFLIQQGYSLVVLVPGRGICSVRRMAFTAGIFYGMDKDSYEGRYCYHTFADAARALSEWNGDGHPSGNWIKRKGHAMPDLSNPDYDKSERVYGD